MNKHIKLLVSVLFIAIIILAIGITSFNFDTSQKTGIIAEPDEIVSFTDTDYSGNRIFKNDDGLFGVADRNERIIIEPHWKKLSFAGNNICIASGFVNGKLLTGCLDFEENIVVPFVFDKIENKNINDTVYYIASVKESECYIIYNENFIPCFNRTWQSVDIEQNKLILSYNDNTYVYAVNSNGMILKNVSVKGQALDTDYTINLSSRVMLSKLNFSMLEKVSDNLGAYISYAFTDDFSFILDNADNSSQPAYKLFKPDSPVYISALPGKISNINVYNLKEADGSQYLYASAVINAKVKYDENGAVKTASRDYNFKVKFKYTNSTIGMISGDIESMTFIPDIPPEAVTKPADNENS